MSLVVAPFQAYLLRHIDLLQCVLNCAAACAASHVHAAPRAESPPRPPALRRTVAAARSCCGWPRTPTGQGKNGAFEEDGLCALKLPWRRLWPRQAGEGRPRSTRAFRIGVCPDLPLSPETFFAMACLYWASLLVLTKPVRPRMQRNASFGERKGPRCLGRRLKFCRAPRALAESGTQKATCALHRTACVVLNHMRLRDRITHYWVSLWDRITLYWVSCLNDPTIVYSNCLSSAASRSRKRSLNSSARTSKSTSTLPALRLAPSDPDKRLSMSDIP